MQLDLVDMIASLPPPDVTHPKWHFDQQDYDLVYDVCQQPKTRARFERKFMPEPMSGCWIWIGARGRKATASSSSRHAKSKGLIAAHRVAWMMYRGRLPAHVLACHRCDNPPCVNPSHLFEGTHGDNSRDCVSKGRWGGPESSAGECNPSALLTEGDVLGIRASDERLSVLARA